MNVDYAPPSKWSVLFYVVLLLLALVIFGCEDSAPSETGEKPPEGEAYEWRIVYQKADSSGNYYYSNLSGDSRLLCDFAKFEEARKNKLWLSFNPLKAKVIYFSGKKNTLNISNYDGSNPVPVKINGKAISEVFEGRTNLGILQYSPTGDWAVCQIGSDIYKIDTLGNCTRICYMYDRPRLGKAMYNELYRVSFSGDGNRFIYGAGMLVICDTLGIMRYKQISGARQPQLAGDKAVFINTNGYGLEITDILTDVNEPIKITPDRVFVNNYNISPDENYITFVGYEYPDVSSLFLYDIKRRFLKTLHKNIGPGRIPMFLSNDYIVWQSEEGAITVMKRDGSESRVLLADASLIGAGYFKMR